ncbi:MAG: hypothetical protein ABW133_13300 [Polyangiaceae bacterium]
MSGEPIDRARFAPNDRRPDVRPTRRHLVRLVAASFAASAGLVTSSAHAFPTSRLTYIRNKGTEQCPAEDVVRTEVATRLGYDPFFVWAERTIVAQIWRETRGFRASVQLLDDKGVVRGTRALRSASEDCGELVKAAALAISIGIDPESATRPPGTPPADVAAPSATKEAPATPSSTPERETTPSVSAAASAAAISPNESGDTRERDPLEATRDAARLQPSVGATLWSAINLAPAVTFGGTVFAGLEWRSLGLFAEVRKSLPASGDGVSADLLAGAILPCLRFDSLFACADLDVGQLRLEGQQVRTARYIAAGARLGAQITARPLALRAHLDVLAPFDRTEVLINGFEAWRLPAVSAALGVGAALPF